MSLKTSSRFDLNLAGRKKKGRRWHKVYRAATLFGNIALIVLLLTIINGMVGYVALQNKIDPASLLIEGVTLQDLTKDELILVLESHVSAGLFRRFEHDLPFVERTRLDVYNLVLERVIKPEIKETWTLAESLFGYQNIQATIAEKYPHATLKFSNWLDWQFITAPQSSDALRAGIRTAILGSLWTVGLAMILAFPIGIGAAIYLEEYAAKDRWINRVIQTNINNLAGVPSIIYGMLGLTIFVRLFESLTSGALFGLADSTTANGRTILSASLTLGLLVLPLLIINTQEAIRSVPNSLRLASFGLGATQWETIWHHVLPGALPGILTGTILSISRALGETAPLIVVGASTFITVDPSSPFSKFTTLPIQIYQWTARPQAEFRNIAAAGIVALLIMLLSLNTSAVILRNRYRK